MPIHGRTIRYVVDRALKYTVAETKFWRGLYGPSGRYPGVSNYKQAVKGIQHGLAGGATVGSFISDNPETSPSGQIPQIPSSGKYTKAYSGRSGKRGRYSQRRCRPYNRSRKRGKYY